MYLPRTDAALRPTLPDPSERHPPERRCRAGCRAGKWQAGDRHGRGSTGIIKLDSFRFFTRGLMSPTKFQRGLLFISDFLTYSLWSPTGKSVVPFITFHRCDIPVRRTRLWQACHRSRTSTADFWQSPTGKPMVFCVGVYKNI